MRRDAITVSIPMARTATNQMCPSMPERTVGKQRDSVSASAQSVKSAERRGRIAINTSVMFSSKTVEWETPQDLFDELNAQYSFETDVCATSENAKCARYYTKEQNGLSQQWTGTCWMNPPYGSQIGRWIRKAYEESQRGATVVALVPAKTDTAWFHDWIKDKAEIEFVRGRIRFAGAKWNAPFPSMIVVYRPKEATR